MAINFPTTPTVNQLYSYGGRVWIWNGYAWVLDVNYTANLAYNQANTAATIANLAFDKANSANVQATAAYGQANSVLSTSVQKTGNTMTGNLVMSGANIAFISLGTGVFLDSYSRVFTSAANVISVYARDGEQIRVNGVANSVNFLRFSGAPTGAGMTPGATTVGPYIGAEGSDAEVPLGIILKGNASIQVGTATTVMRPALTSSWLGYSTGYRSLIIGSANTSYNDNFTGGVTISLGAPTMNVSGGSFTGDGREIIIRRNTQFTTQNAGGQNWQTVYDVQPALYHRFLTDGGEQVRITDTTGAVNYFRLTGAATASNPTISTNAGGITLAPSTGNTLYITSNTGIGTAAPGNYALQTIYSARFINDRTTGETLINGADYALTANATNFFIGLDAQALKINIPSANNDAGYRIAVAAQAFVSDANFVGSLASQYGVWARHGHNVSGAGSRITNSYGVYIDGLSAGSTTITNFWGLYQSGVGTKNYFQGLVGIGTTSPSQNLTVTGNATISTTLTIGGNVGFGKAITETANTRIEVVGASRGSITSLTDVSNTVTPDFASNNYYTLTLTNNFTLAAATNRIPGMSGAIYVIQPNGGGKTLSFNTIYKFASNTPPTITTTSNAVDLIVFTVRTANSIICSYVQNVGDRTDT